MQTEPAARRVIPHYRGFDLKEELRGMCGRCGVEGHEPEECPSVPVWVFKRAGQPGISVAYYVDGNDDT